MKYNSWLRSARWDGMTCLCEAVKDFLLVFGAETAKPLVERLEHIMLNPGAASVVVRVVEGLQNLRNE